MVGPERKREAVLHVQRALGLTVSAVAMVAGTTAVDMAVDTPAATAVGITVVKKTSDSGLV